MKIAPVTFGLIFRLRRTGNRDGYLQIRVGLGNLRMLWMACGLPRFLCVIFNLPSLLRWPAGWRCLLLPGLHPSIA